MKHRFILILYLITTFVRADDTDDKWNDLKNKIVSTSKKTWDGASGFIKGMGQSFGYVTPDYHYSFKVWNDAPAPIFIAVQRITPVLGADFAGTLVASKVLDSQSDTGELFYKQQLYISIWLCAEKGSADITAYSTAFSKASSSNDVATAMASKLFGGIITTEKLKQNSFLRKDIYPWSPNDDNTYYYRAYTDNGAVKGEYLGIKTTTSEFVGTFYNNTDAADIKLIFKKDDESYTVSLEPHSFNFLQSNNDKQFSIRPPAQEQRGFTVLQNDKKIVLFPIAQYGIANVSYNEKTKHYDAAGSMSYTYEIYKKDGTINASMQGLSIGNFTQPVGDKVRDINPVPCHVWYQSADQADALEKKESSSDKNKQSSSLEEVFFDVPETLWLTYRTHDFTLYKKLSPGSVIDFTLIRPQIAEKEAALYAVLLPTQDDVKAKKFLDRLSAGLIVPKFIYTPLASSLEKGIVQTEVNKNGFVIDTTGEGNSGLSGYVMFSDIFNSYGITGDSYYYYLEPGKLKIDQLVNNLYLDDKYYKKDAAGSIVLGDDVVEELKQNILKWINHYGSNKDKVKEEVQTYIMQKGNVNLFTITGGQRVLSAQAQHMIEMFMGGPISIEHYPLIRKAGTNYYTFGLGAKPSQWPAQ